MNHAANFRDAVPAYRLYGVCIVYIIAWLVAGVQLKLNPELVSASLFNQGRKAETND